MPSTTSPSDRHRFISTRQSQVLFNIKVLFIFLVETLRFQGIHLSLRCLVLSTDCSQSILSFKKK